jgi:hypothetical protein
VKIKDFNGLIILGIQVLYLNVPITEQDLMAKKSRNDDREGDWYLDWRVGLVLLCYSRPPEDGTLGVLNILSLEFEVLRVERIHDVVWVWTL